MTGADNGKRLLRSSLGEPSVRTMAMPKDANWLGDIFGGWLMSNADIAGAIHAYRRAHGKVVTVGVRNFDFVAPVYVGDIVTYFTTIKRVGRTSITVDIVVYAERPESEAGEHIRVATASFVYVHVDEHRVAIPVRP